jgi:hypothetical protein
VLISFQREKGVELLNTLEEDLCKECTRPTLRRSIERHPVKVQSSARRMHKVNLFQVPNIKRLSTEVCQEGHQKYSKEEEDLRPLEAE